MPATGLVAPARRLVTVRAIVPVAGMPPKNGVTMLAMPCAISSWFGSWRFSVDMPSATRAHSSDSTAPSSAIVTVGTNSRCTLSQSKSGQTNAGSARGMPPKRVPIVSTGSASQAASSESVTSATIGPGTRVAKRTARRVRSDDSRARGWPESPSRGEASGTPPCAAQNISPTKRRAGRAPSAYGLKSRRWARDRMRLGEEIGRHLVDLQAEQVLDLRDRDQHGDAVGEADDDRDRDVAHQRAEPEPAEREQEHAGEHGRDQQVGDAVALDDAVDDDDEGARRAADLHARAAERRDQEAGDDRGEDSLLGLDAAGDRERHRQRQGDDADGEAGAEVGGEALPVVAGEVVDETRSKGVQARRVLERAGQAAPPAAGDAAPARADRRRRSSREQRSSGQAFEDRQRRARRMGQVRRVEHGRSARACAARPSPHAGPGR